MSDAEAAPPPEEKKEEEAPPAAEGEEGDGEKKESDSESLSRSVMDYIMPVKEMVEKMVNRRKYVVISDDPDCDYLEELAENFVTKADIIEEEMYHLCLDGNLQRNRITRYLQKSTLQMEFPYIFVNGEYWNTFEKFQKYAEGGSLHSKVHGVGRDWDIQTGSVSFAVESFSIRFQDAKTSLRKSLEQRGIIEEDTRTEKEKAKAKRKKVAEKAKKRKEKEKKAKKARIKRKLEWKARKKMARMYLATIGINIPEETKEEKQKRRKKKAQKKKQKAQAAREKEKAKKQKEKEKAQEK